MTIPATVLSLVYHSSLSDGMYHDAIHDNIETAFETFGVTQKMCKDLGAGLTAKGFSISSLTEASKLLEVGKRIEVSAKDRRKANKRADVKERAAMGELTKLFFERMSSWLAAEIALGFPISQDQPSVAGSGAVAENPERLTNRLYSLVYASNYRNSGPIATHGGPLPFDSVAWEALLTARNAGKGDYNVLLPHCRTLCGQVAEEFIEDFWEFVW
jgi:hypothetical protein